MSIFCGVVTIVQDPELLELGGKKVGKLRCVDKAMSKKHEDRFFNALLHGFDGDTALRLKKGDQIEIAGTLGLTSYKSKKTGQMVQADEMGFGTRILKVVKSPSFFGNADEAPPAENAAPADVAPPKGAGPLDDLEF